jgi:hypothetical protein
MTELAQIRSDSETETSQPQPKKPGKLNRNERITQLIAGSKRDRARIAELERQLSARESVDAELARLRSIVAEREAQQRTMPERVAQALAAGRKEFADFDTVVSVVKLDVPAFEVLLATTNGSFLMYTAGLGTMALQILRNRQSQAQADARRVQHYRQLHQQHFGEQVNHGL